MKTLMASFVLAVCALSAHAKDFLIDVRSAQEYADGHIAGAIHIEHTSIAQEITKAGVAKDDTVRLYCRSGRRSALALEVLQGMGYTRVENLGGIEQARAVLGKK